MRVFIVGTDNGSVLAPTFGRAVRYSDIADPDCVPQTVPLAGPLAMGALFAMLALLAGSRTRRSV